MSIADAAIDLANSIISSLDSFTESYSPAFVASLRSFAEEILNLASAVKTGDESAMDSLAALLGRTGRLASEYSLDDIDCRPDDDSVRPNN